MRRPQVILVVTLAVLGVLAALPLGEGSWPCCDDCGICNRMMPPKCRCNDISAHGCHPECKKCVRNTLTADDDGPGSTVRAYRCADMLTNFCELRCTTAPAAAFLGEVF
ncbi:unnamed protein product [Miscanthus lutarioriparius]|uniref:Bowman-Birk serine protease inhibitors family domain-containing protein n=1 Tax=Miscanthus lutarioriparius TaxID=422564 RepID=A0A811Q9T4_9POAL|nr:unnamed protein product [Miscanthus lutarioriparius]